MRKFTVQRANPKAMLCRARASFYLPHLFLLAFPSREGCAHDSTEIFTVPRVHRECKQSDEERGNGSEPLGCENRVKGRLSKLAFVARA